MAPPREMMGGIVAGCESMTDRISSRAPRGRTVDGLPPRDGSAIVLHAAAMMVMTVDKLRILKMRFV